MRPMTPFESFGRFRVHPRNSFAGVACGSDSLFRSAKRFFSLFCFLLPFFLLLAIVSDPRSVFATASLPDSGGSHKTNYLVIRGIADDQGKLLVYPLYITDDARFAPPEEKGPYVLELRNASNLTTASYSFGTEPMTVMTQNGTDPKMDSGLFAFSVPLSDGCHKVVIRKTSQILWEWLRTPNTPVVSILEPKNGSILNGKVDFSWKGSDPDGDPLWYLLESGNGNAATWEPLSALMQEEHFSVDTTLFPSGRAILFRVLCTDGFNTASSFIRVSVSNPRKSFETFPFDGETHVDLRPTISIRFPDPVKKENISERTFQVLRNGTNAVPGEILYDDTSHEAFFILSDSLDPLTRYTVRIAADAEKVEGAGIGPGYEWTFTTGPAH